MNVKLENLPRFAEIRTHEIKQQLSSLIEQNKQELAELLKQRQAFSWETLIYPLENISDRLDQFWSMIQHLHGVCNTPELREAYNECLPILSDYSTELAHNLDFFHAVESIAHSSEYQSLDLAQRRCIDNDLRDFKLSGIALDAERKQRFADLVKQLVQLQSHYEENVLDATHAWQKPITDEAELSGLPPRVITAAKAAAEKNKLSGWVFTLEAPSYSAVVRYADSEKLRKEMYSAYVTRASELGPNAGRWDNSQIMLAILNAEFEIAKLLGFENYVEKSLATKMAKSAEEVLNFLSELSEASKPKAEVEFEELQQFAKKQGHNTPLQPWDIAYYSEKLRLHDYALSQEDLRSYFPEPQVLQGLFEIIYRLFKLQIKKVSNAQLWHPDVQCYAIYDLNDQLIAAFYIDLYGRENKRGGAWMDDCRVRRRLADGSIQTPIAFVSCNFNAPVNGEPALFYHDDVVTLFHEFGHALQHLLTTVNYSAVSGINGVPWDAVEFASQFFENWAWQKEGLALIARHYQTGEALPDSLFEQMNKAKNFQAALSMMRQIKFSLFDFRLFLEFDPNKNNQIQEIMNEVHDTVDVLPTPEFNRFQHHFSHIFAGGYSAGYYSYKWAEVMACDAFSLFEENGLFDTHTSNAFLECILQTGGSEDPAVLFKRFRGREPDVTALLKHAGII